MEIITYVRRGAITHKDSRGNKGRTTAGNIQVMSAGTGIQHSEFNREDEETNIFQIWILKSRGIEPRWDTAEFPARRHLPAFRFWFRARDAPLSIHQDVRIYAGRMNQGRNSRIQFRARLIFLSQKARCRLTKSTHPKVTV